MKKWILKIVTFGIIVISQESCVTINAEKFFSQHHYESEMPFEMADNTLNAPLIVRKGQINLNGSFLNGHNLSMTLAVSNKLFFETGGSFSSRDNSKTSSAIVEVNENKAENNTDSTYNTKISYMNHSSLRISTINFGIGIFQKVGKYGCLEFHSGFIHGDANTKYQYSFNYLGNNFYINSYSFAEGRQLSQFYFQSDFGFVNSWSEGVLIARTSYLHYSDQNFEKEYNIPEYKMNADQVVFQPGLQFGIGGSFRVYGQISWNIPLSDRHDSWYHTNIQIGAVIKIKGRPNKIKI